MSLRRFLPARRRMPRLAGPIASVAVVVSLASVASHALPARADESTPVVAPSARRIAVEAEIVALERLLVPLRKVRTELRAGKAEVLPPTEEGRAAHEVAVRGVREALRYEAVRGKAVTMLAEALAAKDEKREAEARRELDDADRRAAEAFGRIAAAVPGSPAADGDEAGRTSGKAKPADKPASGKPSSKPSERPSEPPGAMPGAE